MNSAYGRQTPPPVYELTCVEPGSPMGELLRRYWQPVCTSDELCDLPKKVKLLCEELVVFRDKKGRVGALEPRQIEFGKTRRREFEGLPAVQDHLNQLGAQKGEVDEASEIATSDAVAL